MTLPLSNCTVWKVCLFKATKILMETETEICFNSWYYGNDNLGLTQNECVRGSFLYLLGAIPPYSGVLHSFAKKA